MKENLLGGQACCCFAQGGYGRFAALCPGQLIKDLAPPNATYKACETARDIGYHIFYELLAVIMNA